MYGLGNGMIDSGFDRLRVQRGHPVNASLN